MKRVSTDPHHLDPELAGRTYAIPFDRVWKAARQVAEERGWTITRTDDTQGLIVAEAVSPLRRKIDDIEIRIVLDDDAQTRVDMVAGPRKGSFDLGRNRRRIRRLVRGLDRILEADASKILKRPPPSGVAALILATALLGTGGCESPSPELEAPSPDSVAAEVESVRSIERLYERALVFQAEGVDSALAVSWLVDHELGSGLVDQHARGWLLRGGIWDPFFDSVTTYPATDTPWRILPVGPMRLVVGERDRIDRIRFAPGDRMLDFRVEEAGPEWSGARGGSFRVLGGSIVLGDRRFGGRILDLSRTSQPSDGTPGDWVFLTSGENLAVVLQSPVQTREVNGFEGWALMGGEEIRWPQVTLDWAESRPFDRARRDVPVSWTLRSSEGELSGVMEVRSAQLNTLEGSGPLLPIDGLIQVAGTLVIRGVEYPVRGVVRHQQGRIYP